MQILPTSTKTATGDPFFGMGAVEAQQTASSFAALLSGQGHDAQAAFNTVRRQAAETADAGGQAAAGAARGAAEVAASATRRAASGATQNEAFRRVEQADTDIKQTKMTSMDFARVKESLSKYGLSKKDIEELEDRVNSKGGLTWGAFISSLMQKTTELAQAKPVNQLSVVQKQELDMFFQKIGYTAQESAGLLKDLENGKFTDVLAVLQKKLDSIPKDKLLELSPKGVHALAEAMNLSDQTKQQIAQLISGGEREVFLPTELKNALALIQKEDAQRMQDKAQAVKDLQKDLASVLREAKDRALGNDGGQERAKIIETGKDETMVDRFLGKDAKAAADKGQARDPLQAAAEHGNRDKGEARDGDKGQDKGKAVRDDMAARSGKETKADKDDPLGWKTFWERVEDKGDARQVPGQTAGQARAKAPEQPLPETRQERYSDQQRILDQIQGGISKNLPNGVSRLTLQLEPENLGTVNLTIQVQGKEVRALIRTENQDVTQALQDQLAQVRQSLEQQGLKVSELEVRTGLSDASLSGRNWMSAEQHNQEQERQAMADLRERMRNLRSGDAEAVRETMADIRRAYGDNGLHLIA